MAGARLHQSRRPATRDTRNRLLPRGTLLSIAAAAMARDNDARLASVTLLATETDFEEPGEMSLFIDESQVRILRTSCGTRATSTANRWRSVYAAQLQGPDMVKDGPRIPDGAAADADRLDGVEYGCHALPYRMHSEFLRRLYLRNDLARGATLSTANRPS